MADRGMGIIGITEADNPATLICSSVFPVPVHWGAPGITVSFLERIINSLHILKAMKFIMVELSPLFGRMIAFAGACDFEHVHIILLSLFYGCIYRPYEYMLVAVSTIRDSRRRHTTSACSVSLEPRPNSFSRIRASIARYTARSARKSSRLFILDPPIYIAKVAVIERASADAPVFPGRKTSCQRLIFAPRVGQRLACGTGGALP